MFVRGNTAAVTSTVEMQRFDVAFPRDTEPSPGTEGGIALSPDGRIVAMTAWKKGVRRPPPFVLARRHRDENPDPPGVEVGGGLAWGETGIVFGRERSMWIVDGEGGAARRLTTLDAERGEVWHIAPAILPGGRIAPFSTSTSEPGGERIEAVPTSGGPRSVVLERARSPAWSPTGHLLFTRNGVVLAVPFDALTATVTGTPTPIFPSCRQ